MPSIPSNEFTHLNLDDGVKHQIRRILRMSARRRKLALEFGEFSPKTWGTLTGTHLRKFISRNLRHAVIQYYL